MDTLALRLAAGGGTIDDLPAAALVAAGFTLLQRCPPLVRALGNGRCAIMLPPSPAFLVALAASDGRAAVLLDPNLRPDVIAHRLREEDARAVLSLRGLAARLPSGTIQVLLDDAPRAARFVDAEGSARAIDLGAHFGLSVEGPTDGEGRPEECLITVADPDTPGTVRASHTHAALLTGARRAAREKGLTAASEIRAGWDWSRPAPLTATLLAPLVAGSRIRTSSAPVR